MSEQQGGSRGQAEVLATVLLFGIVIMAAVALAAVAMGAFGGSQDLAEEQAIERALLELRSASSDVALQGEAQRSVDMDLPDGASIEVREDAGTMTVEHYNHTGEGDDHTEELYNVSLGAIEITNDDYTYALQGGGIFRQELGYGSMMAPPTIGHRGLTLTVASLPIEGEGFSSGSSSVTIRPGSFERPAFPKPSETYTDFESKFLDNPVENGSVIITVQSPYYEGWYQYFDQRTEGSATIFHNNNTAVAKLEALDEITITESITLVQGYDEQGNPDLDEESIQTNTNLPDSVDIIEYELQQARNESDTHPCIEEDELTEDCGDTFEEGTYYLTDDTELGSDIDINTEDGDVTFVVDGDFDIGGNDISVSKEGPDYGVTYYVRGDLEAQGGGSVTTESEAIQADRNVFFVGEDVFPESEGQGGIEFHSIIYASNADITMRGSPIIKGALYAEHLDAGGDTAISFDESLAEDDFTISFANIPTPITYLHITENTAVIDIE